MVVNGEERTFRVRIYSATDLVRLLERAGFVDIEVYGGFDRSAFDPWTRLAVRARRS